MRSMNTYVCDTKPASNKSQKTKKKKKTIVIAVIATKGRRKKVLDRTFA